MRHMEPINGHTLVTLLDDAGLIPETLDRRDLHARVAIQVAFQPIFDSAGEYVAAEALARISVDGHQLPARAVIRQCREMDLLPSFSSRVHQLAIATFAQYREAGSAPPLLCLNASHEELVLDSFPVNLLRMIDRASVPGSSIVLEVTEDSPRPQWTEVVTSLSALRVNGVTVALDDFGAGSSGLLALRHVQPHWVKLDKGFMPSLQPGDVMLRSIIDMSHRMGMKVVAEGVEQLGEAQVLLGLGCDMLQGHLLGRPGLLADRTQSTVDCSRRGR